MTTGALDVEIYRRIREGASYNYELIASTPWTRAELDIRCLPVVGDKLMFHDKVNGKKITVMGTVVDRQWAIDGTRHEPLSLVIVIEQGSGALHPSVLL